MRSTPVNRPARANLALAARRDGVAARVARLHDNRHNNVSLQRAAISA